MIRMLLNFISALVLIVGVTALACVGIWQFLPDSFKQEIRGGVDRIKEDHRWAVIMEAERRGEVTITKPTP